jgi:hypothetical protein
MTNNAGRRVNRPAREPEPTQDRVSSPLFCDRFPTLWNFLAIRRDLGEIHQTGSITIFVDGEKIKLCMNDRPTRQSCFVSGDTLGEALERADRGIVEGSLTWSSVGYKRRSAKKVYKTTPLLDT